MENNNALASRAALEVLRNNPHDRELADRIFAWLESGDGAVLHEALEAHHAADVAQAVEHLDTADAVRAIGLMREPDRAVVFGYLSGECQVEMARRLRRRELAAIVTAMSHDERADLYKQLDEDDRDNLLPALAQAEREDLRKLASYPEGTAGSVMTSDYAVLTPEMSASQALEELRRQAPDSETIYQAYIVDGNRQLLGTVGLRDLLVARNADKVADLMDRRVRAIGADDPREEAARLIARYDLMALPVINGGHKLVGIVTQDDAMDVQTAEATEDFHRVGTVQKLQAGVKEASIFMLYRARIVWLVLLVFGNTLSGAGIAYFEDTITAYVALVFFLPLLIGSGGNAGSQSATLMVRALATGDVKFGDWGMMIGREALVALLLGLTMALAVSTLGLVRGGPEVALVVSLSMVAIVISGSLVGMSLPFVLARFKFDPATASAPLVTSIADATGVIIYFSLATAFLPLD